MLQIQYDGIIFKEGHTYVSYCPELDVSSCGHNIDEVRLFQLFFQLCQLGGIEIILLI